MKYLYLALLIFFFTGCISSYPLNLSKEEYQSLSIEEKIKVKKAQANLDNKLRIQRIKRDFELRKLELKMDQELYNLYNKSDEKLIVSIKDGNFRYMKNGYYIEAFEIVKYEVKKIKVYDKKYHSFHHNIWVSFQETGLYFGIEPKYIFRNMNSYVSFNPNDFFRDSRQYLPYLISFNPSWQKSRNHIISFDSKYRANKLKVSIYSKDNFLKSRYYYR